MTLADQEHPAYPPRTTYLVKQLELAIRAGMDAIAGEFGVTALQYTALSVLARHPGLSAAQMARRSFVSAQAGNEMVGILKRKGLITRTPAGYSVLSQCDESIDQLETKMLDAVAPADVEVLRKALAACVQSLTG